MAEPRIIGRHVLHAKLASGGMATVHLGRLMGQVGFARTVAIKRLHQNFARDPEFVSMFLDEARVAARVRHACVVPVLDVEAGDGELFLVMEYVHGESLSSLMRLLGGQPVPPAIAARIAADVLSGLHAAHNAKTERGEPLHIVHRDVSPQNVLVGADGMARVTDFGVAMAVNRMQTTQEGQLKGKLAYMAPEQLREELVDRRSDVYAASVVLWEMLTGRRLHKGVEASATMRRILEGQMPRVSSLVASIDPVLDEIVSRGLDKDPSRRFVTAEQMAVALERRVRCEPAAAVAAWVRSTAGASLRARERLLAEVETSDADRARPSRASLPIIEPAAAITEPTPVGASESQSKSNVALLRSLQPVVRKTGFGVLAGLLVPTGLAFALVLFVLLSRAPRYHPSESEVRSAPAAPLASSPSVESAAPPASALPAPSAEPPRATADAGAPLTRASGVRNFPRRFVAPRPAVEHEPKSSFGSLRRE
jgi:eukaryotic-like serine/threonine-protein kinase